MLPRETIYGALFDRLNTITLLRTCSRRLRHYDDVGATDTPALFMLHKGENVERDPHTPTKHELRVELWVYVKHDQADDSVPAVELNPVLDAIEAALEPDKITHRQTLGGTVYHCRIDGEIELDSGFLGSVATAIVPVLILVP